jgi:hypothetical protein
MSELEETQDLITDMDGVSSHESTLFGDYPYTRRQQRHHYTRRQLVPRSCLPTAAGSHRDSRAYTGASYASAHTGASYATSHITPPQDKWLPVAHEQGAINSLNGDKNPTI